MFDEPQGVQPPQERPLLHSARDRPEEGEDSRVLTAIIVGLHLIVCVVLVLLVLLHSGRGGGLSDMFGGGVGTAAAGSTVVERNLDRLTVGAALVFAFTTIILAIRLQ